MQIAIEGTIQAPTALLLAGGRRLAVEKVLDRWPGEDHLYLEVRCTGGGHFILRYDRAQDSWSLAVYRSSEEDL